MKRLLILAFVFTSFSIFAQQRDSIRYPLNRFTIKWSPLHVLDFYSTFQVSLEQRIGQNISLLYDVGPVFSTPVEEGKYSDQRGVKAKLQVRFYIKPRTKYWAFYYTPELYYNHVNYDKSETFMVNSDYYQYITYGMKYRERGATLKVGSVFSIKRFSIDFQLGVAFRNTDYTAINQPSLPGYRLIEKNDPFFGRPTVIPDEKDSNRFQPTACIRLGYILAR